MPIQDLADSPNFKDFILESETVSEAIVGQVLSGNGKQKFLTWTICVIAVAEGVAAVSGVWD